MLLYKEKGKLEIWDCHKKFEKQIDIEEFNSKFTIVHQLRKGSHYVNHLLLASETEQPRLIKLNMVDCKYEVVHKFALNDSPIAGLALNNKLFVFSVRQGIYGEIMLIYDLEGSRKEVKKPFPFKQQEGCEDTVTRLFRVNRGNYFLAFTDTSQCWLVGGEQGDVIQRLQMTNKQPVMGVLKFKDRFFVSHQDG